MGVLDSADSEVTRVRTSAERSRMHKLKAEFHRQPSTYRDIAYPTGDLPALAPADVREEALVHKHQQARPPAPLLVGLMWAKGKCEAQHRRITMLLMRKSPD